MFSSQLKAVQLIKHAEVIVYDDLGTQVGPGDEVDGICCHAAMLAPPAQVATSFT